MESATGNHGVSDMPPGGWGVKRIVGEERIGGKRYYMVVWQDSLVYERDLHAPTLIPKWKTTLGKSRGQSGVKKTKKTKKRIEHVQGGPRRPHPRKP